MDLSAILSGIVPSDEQTMLRVQSSDDHRAFAVLVEKWQTPIRDLCIRMMGDAHRGEDLKQETFSRLYERRREYKPTGKFSSYLWRMALNLCYDEIRRNKRHVASPLEDETDQAGGSNVPADQESPREKAARAEEGEIVRDAIQALPEIYRTVVILRHYENLKMREIAEVLGVPAGTIHSRLAEALAQLARRLEPHLDIKNSTSSLPVCVPRRPEISAL